MNELQDNGRKMEYISASEAGARSGFTRAYITRLCKSGQIKGRMINGKWFVPVSSLMRFVAANEEHRAVTSRIIKAVKENDRTNLQALIVEAAHLRRFLG